MSKRKKIEALEAEIQDAHDDYQHTHDALWRILSILCGEFGLGLQARPTGEDHPRSEAFTLKLIEALERADRLVPHSAKRDDAFDDVWDLVEQYRGSELK